MGKYLRDISIHVDSGQLLPGNRLQKDFNITTHTVQDIFWYNIPSKFELNGISKLNIIIQEPIEDREFNGHFDGFADYHYMGFDFENYFSLTYYEKNKKILEVLKETLKEILKDNQDKLNIFLDITDKIRKDGFVHEHESKKLSKFHKSQKIRASVIFRIDEKGQNAFLKIKNKKGKELLTTHLLKNRVYDFWDNLHKSKWEDNKFQLINRNGKIYKEFKIKID